MKSQEHESAEQERPVGRFLLEPESETVASCSYEYAVLFANDNKDLLNHRWRASRVSTEEINGQRVELEFVANDNATNQYVWHLCANDEQYDFYCNEAGECRATHYEFTSQRAVMKRREITEPTALEVLQDIVEYMTNTGDFFKNMLAIREDLERTQSAIKELDAKKSVKTISHGEEKNLAALKSHLFIAGFPVGSRDISKRGPLIQ